MAEKEKLLKELKAVRERYMELFGKLTELGIPGVIDPEDLVAATCNAGDSCHGGSTDQSIDQIIRRATFKEK